MPINQQHHPVQYFFKMQVDIIILSLMGLMIVWLLIQKVQLETGCHGLYFRGFNVMLR